MMEFLLYLTSFGRDIYSIVSQKVQVVENTSICTKNRKIYGWYSSSKNTLIMCTKNIKTNSNYRYYINETLFHESVHVAQNCKSNQTGMVKLGVNTLLISPNKLNDVNNSVSISGPKYYNIEKEAYYLEDKPNKISNYLKKYCF